MSQNFKSGDFLVFQLEAGFALLRILAIDEGEEPVWHVAAYSEMFLDVDSAESAINSFAPFSFNVPHAALTDRAFLATQVSKIANRDLEPSELLDLDEWRNSAEKTVSDRSIRLLMGLR